MFGLHSWCSPLSANNMIHSAVRAALAIHETTGRTGFGSGLGEDDDAQAPTATASTSAARVLRSTPTVKPFSV